MQQRGRKKRKMGNIDTHTSEPVHQWRKSSCGFAIDMTDLSASDVQHLNGIACNRNNDKDGVKNEANACKCSKEWIFVCDRMCERIHKSACRGGTDTCCLHTQHSKRKSQRR